ncbi:MAG: NAD(P)-binding protein [Candidatus Micrarchaeaceae archaeon]
MRAIQKLLIISMLAIFAASTVAIYAVEKDFFIAVIWSFINIIGVELPPSEALVDTANPLVVAALSIEIIGELMFVILVTTILYDLMGKVNFKRKAVADKARNASNHIIMTPFNKIAAEMSKKLAASNVPFVIIDRNRQKVDAAIREKMIAIEGTPKEIASLSAANAQKAYALVLLGEDDMENTLSVIAAKHLNSRIKVAARIKKEEDIPRMRRAGVSHLVLPEHAIGDEIASSIIGAMKRSGS